MKPKTRRCRFVILVVLYSVDFASVVAIFVQVFISSLEEKQRDLNDAINYSTASLKNEQGADAGFKIFMVVMIAIFCCVALLFVLWVWVISFRLARHFGRFMVRSLQRGPNEFVQMYGNDIRVIRDIRDPRSKARRLRYGFTPDGSLARIPNAPRGI